MYYGAMEMATRLDLRIIMKDLLLVILGAILGWLGQWLFYRYQKRDEQRQRPNVVISRVTKNNEFLLELRNIGQDSLSEMEVMITWQKSEQQQQKKLEQFFSPDLSISVVTPVHLELLGSGERYVLTGLPQSTDDGVIDVEVSGLGVRSGQLYKANTQVVVTLSSGKA